MSESNQHSELRNKIIGELRRDPVDVVAIVQALDDLEEQLEALRLAATRQLTPLDVAATHIDILRRKSEDYGPQERDNVASIVEAHVNEARNALFAAISNPAMSRQDSPSTTEGDSDG